ncbi:MAG: hypothetical protein U0M12_08320 [Acutalibacteraceae bacterium]|nr:hypothetical protein [Acutalibacteraceae bacterium]
MDDITGKISQLLSDPQAMEQIMSLKNLLIPDEKEDEHTQTVEETKPLLPLGADDTMKTVMRLMPLLSDIKQEDDTTRLLRALRPFLSEERRCKLDEATKILQIMKILPVIKQLNL